MKLTDVFLQEAGTGVPAFAPPRAAQGLPPLPWKMGQDGEATTAPSVAWSQLMQRTMVPDDVEYWQGDPDDPEDLGASFDPPYLLSKDSFGNLQTPVMNGPGSTTYESLRRTIRLMIESIIDEDEEEVDGDEASEISAIGGGAVAGYTGPLGQKSRDKKQDKVNQESFGGGTYNE